MNNVNITYEQPPCCADLVIRIRHNSIFPRPLSEFRKDRNIVNIYYFAYKLFEKNGVLWGIFSAYALVK